MCDTSGGSLTGVGDMLSVRVVGVVVVGSSVVVVGRVLVLVRVRVVVVVMLGVRVHLEVGVVMVAVVSGCRLVVPVNEMGAAVKRG